MEIREEEIVVPWGKIAAKVWGKQTDVSILCFHGVMDNAGTFNNLIPYLPKIYQYVCIDLPGHGRSSHFPPHLPIYSTSYIIAYLLIMEYFKQDKYIIIGHSYGGQIALLFARMYPEKVDKLIILDTVSLFPIPANNFIDYFADKMESHVYLMKKLENGTAPTYTYEKAVEKIAENRRGNSEITEEAALALAERGLIKVGENRYKFSIDQRLKQFINPQHDFRYILDSMKERNIKCPVLIILGKKSQQQQIFMKPILKQYQKMPNIRIKIVEGNHDLHNNTPENAAPYIRKFLEVSNKL